MYIYIHTHLFTIIFTILIVHETNSFENTHVQMLNKVS